MSIRLHMNENQVCGNNDYPGEIDLYLEERFNIDIEDSWKYTIKDDRTLNDIIRFIEDWYRSKITKESFDLTVYFESYEKRNKNDLYCFGTFLENTYIYGFKTHIDALINSGHIKRNIRDYTLLKEIEITSG